MLFRNAAVAFSFHPPLNKLNLIRNYSSQFIMAEKSDSDMFVEDKASDIVYHWFIVFQWNHKTETPFSIHVINPTFVNIIPQSWLSGKLEPKCRKQKLRIKTLSTKIGYSIFAKIEKGNNIIYYSIIIIIIIITIIIIKQELQNPCAMRCSRC